MTADTEKEQSANVKSNTQCLICNSRLGVSSRNSLEIFSGDVVVTTSDRPLSVCISSILEQELCEESVHSTVICKKCYKLLNEADEIEMRMAEIRAELQDNYKRTLVLQVEGDKAALELDAEDDDTAVIDKEQKLVVRGRKKVLKKPDGENSDEDFEPGDRAVILEPEMMGNTGGSDDEMNINTNMNVVPSTQDGNMMEAEGELHLKIKLEPGEITHMKHYMGRRPMMKKKARITVHEVDHEQVIMRDGSDFACLLCTSSEKVIGDMKGISTHMKTVHSIRVYICDICGQDFRKRNELSLHLDDHVAAEEGDFQCEVCNRIFSNLRLFRVHKRMHYPQAKLWTCETCGKRYSSRNLLDEHINTHLGVRPYKCKMCSKDFASKYTFKAHMKTHEVRPRPYCCNDCGKTFLSQQNLMQHERTHNGMRNYVCDQCGKAFGTARNLEVHSVVHSGYKPFICRTCGKAFARKAEIRDHERIHTGEKPYQCEFCGATFSQRSNLQSHKRATHYQDKRYKCMDCGKGFKRRRLLDYHVKAAHTGERPYKCPICEATFVYPEHFKKHRRIHTGEKPFLCEVCGKAFNSRDNRNAHRFVHSDKKPYECLVCGMGFMRKPLLYNHMQSQGHMNDTIVVNQPRLTNEDDILNVTDDAGEVEMTIVEGSAGHETDTKLYIAELKEHVLIQEGEEEHVYTEKLEADGEGGVHEAVEHLIIDGQVHFADPNEIANLHGDIGSVAEITTTTAANFSQHRGGEGRHTLVVPATPNMLSAGEMAYEEGEHQGQEASIMTLSSPQAIQTSGGPVHLVQIRIPSDQSGTRNWFSTIDSSQ